MSTDTPDDQPLDAAEADGSQEPAPADDPAAEDASDVPGTSPLHDDLPSPES